MKVVSKSSGGKKTSFRLLDGEIEGYGVHMYILTVSIALLIAMGRLPFRLPLRRNGYGLLYFPTT